MAPSDAEPTLFDFISPEAKTEKRERANLERPCKRLRHWKAIVADPKVKAAVRDVDQSLLDWTLGLTPLEKLRCASNAARALNRFKRVETETS